MCPEWMNLGDSKEEEKSFGEKLRALLMMSPRYLFFRIRQFHFRRWLKRLPDSPGLGRLSNRQYSQNFREWFYTKGDLLPFDATMFTFVYSEHFFEHLFFDEAVALLREVYRVLSVGGVLRIVVPDADLRRSESPEPVGFPDRRMSFDNPHKHKTRWNVYQLAESLRLSGLYPMPLVFWDREGVFHNEFDKISTSVEYRSILDSEVVYRNDYIIRLNSLIVDGIKL